MARSRTRFGHHVYFAVRCDYSRWSSLRLSWTDSPLWPSRGHAHFSIWRAFVALAVSLRRRLLHFRVGDGLQSLQQGGVHRDAQRLGLLQSRCQPSYVVFTCRALGRLWSSRSIRMTTPTRPPYAAATDRRVAAATCRSRISFRSRSGRDRKRAPCRAVRTRSIRD
jgi:hypothetical protein